MKRKKRNFLCVRYMHDCMMHDRCVLAHMYMYSMCDVMLALHATVSMTGSVVITIMIYCSPLWNVEDRYCSKWQVHLCT